jgi:Flp pilus assembly protein TadD
VKCTEPRAWARSRAIRVAGAHIALVVAASALAACHNTPGGSGSPAGAAPTYSKDIAPIVAQRCAPCHHAGGSAPFALVDYESIRTRGRLVRSAVQKRFMPPWLPEPGDVALAGDRHLTDPEIAAFERWIDAGMPEGNRADLPAAPEFPDAWQLGEPDLVVQLPRPYTLPASGADVWRNFVVPIPVTNSRFVKTIEVRPGSARFVHHAIMAIDETGSSRRRDALDAEVGFDGMDMGDAHMPDGSILGWTPGMLPFPGIEDVRWQLDPGTDMVLQLHMVPSGKAETIDPVIGFHFARAVDPGSATYALQLDADDQLDIPAEASDFNVTDTIVLPVDVELLAAYPHAHFLGKRVELSATLPDGGRRSLVRIERWDFKWQDVYRFANPVVLPRGTSVTLRWTFDNSSSNPRQVNHPVKRVTAGNRSSDEMAHLLLQMRLKTFVDRDLLKETHYAHLVQKNPRNAKFLWALGGVLKDRGRLAEAADYYRQALAVQPDYVSARINLGAVLMGLNRSADAIDQFRAAVRLDPDNAGAHYNLAIALTTAGRLDEAIREYRQAIRGRPQFAHAHNNVGQLLAATGHLDEALVHLREAARLLPESANVHQNLGLALRSHGDLPEAARELQRAEQLGEGRR